MLARARATGAGVVLALGLARCRSPATNGSAPVASGDARSAPTVSASSEARVAETSNVSNAGRGEREARDPAPDKNRLYVVAGAVDVMENPSARVPTLGSVRAGGSVDLSPLPLVSSGGDCPEGWWPVLPRGFVCAKSGTTRDERARAVEVLGEYRLSPRAALPASYGIAEISPLYLRLPTWDEQLRSEPGLEAHLHERAALREGRVAARAWGDVSGAQDADLEPAGGDLPDDVKAGSFAPVGAKRLLPNSPVTGSIGPGARVAWLAELDTAGRTWLLTTDWLFVPRDKVKRSVVSGFHGVDVAPGRGVAFVGQRPARRYRQAADGKHFVSELEMLAPATVVFLAEPSAKAREGSDDAFVESVEPGVFLRTGEVIVASPAPPSRWGIDADGAPDARWIEIDAKRQVLLLREGSRVSFATLVSVGADVRRGKFRISSKHLTLATPFEHPRPGGGKAEVPEVMLASETPDGQPASALFAGWWMSAWGSSNGGFGIALAPLDARRVFDSTAPALPDGWHSVRGEGTWVVVHD